MKRAYFFTISSTAVGGWRSQLRKQIYCIFLIWFSSRTKPEIHSFLNFFQAEFIHGLPLLITLKYKHAWITHMLTLKHITFTHLWMTWFLRSKELLIGLSDVFSNRKNHTLGCCILSTSRVAAVLRKRRNCLCRMPFLNLLFDYFVEAGGRFPSGELQAS